MSFPNDTQKPFRVPEHSVSVKLQLPASIASHCRTTASSPTSAGGSRTGAVTGAGVALLQALARWLGSDGDERMGFD